MKYQLKGNYFNGKYHMPPTKGTDAVENIIRRFCPADLKNLLWECPVDYRDIPKAIDSSCEGFKKWRLESVEKRIQYLQKFQEQVLSRKGEMAEAIALETGKPLWEALTEANAVISKVSVTIENSLPRITHQKIDNIMPNTTGHVFFKPIGPCLIIGPFNFPCHLANGQILSALIAGNSIIFKPSEKTCYSAQILMDCFHSAGFPKGVINLVQGDGDSARRLLSDQLIKGVFFTGSKEVGLKILSTTHTDLSKMVALELGGKNASILHKDANLDYALIELIKACFLTTGQRCISTSIIPIHRSIKDEFIDRFHQISKKIIIDHPIDFEEKPFMGPLVDQQSLDNYLLFIGMAKREGFEEIMRGKKLEKRFQGHYVSPSIHYKDHFDKKSHFLMTEVFGPNCTFIPYDDIEEAIEMTNSTEYGLSSSIFTKDQDIYKLCVRDIDSGLVNLNKSTVGASSKLPFGGIKNSGNYHPASVATIDACVYQMSGLEIQSENCTIEELPGIRK